jgi:hypothetical protein
MAAEIDINKVQEIEKEALDLIQRIFLPTPDFWKKVRNISGISAAIATTILGLSGTLHLPNWVIVIAQMVVASGVVLAGAAQSTVKGE